MVILSSCKCYYYYSPDNKSELAYDSLFQVEIQINSFPKNESDNLEITIYSDSSKRVFKNSFRIYPIVEGKNDTLKLKKEYDSHYYFRFYKKWPEKINVNLQFDVDSIGSFVHKSIIIKGLLKKGDCEAGFATH